ncbi:MAG: DnaB helicase C-terminal domain-containing protein [Candidatus Omnitrophica bacterium]|nr:DnaB helicase C-terminal domain-containing protein [Candidatus Omnitrophota bacterium]
MEKLKLFLLRKFEELAAFICFNNDYAEVYNTILKKEEEFLYGYFRDSDEFKFLMTVIDKIITHNFTLSQVVNHLKIPQYRAIAENVNILDLNKAIIYYINEIKIYEKINYLARNYMDLSEEEKLKLLNKINSYKLDDSDGFLNITEVVNISQERIRNTEYFSSSLPTLNKNYNNKVYRTADLHVIAARPGTGKTMLLLQEAKHIAKQGCKVAFFTLEMPAYQCVMRMTSNETGENITNLYTKEIFNERVKRLEEAVQDNLLIFEDYNVTASSLARKIMYVAKQGFKVVFIDQLSHISNDSKAYSEASAIEHTVRMLRSLALKLNIAIIIACQINRQALEKEEPSVENLKGSGSIEEASQLVIIFYNKKDGYTKMKVVKSTHNRTFDFDVKFKYEFSEIIEGTTIANVENKNIKNEEVNNMFVTNKNVESKNVKSTRKVYSAPKVEIIEQPEPPESILDWLETMAHESYKQ